MKKHIETAKRYAKKKRVMALVFLSLCVLTFVLFRNSFLGFGLELFINSKLKASSGVKCRFEKMKFRSGHLEFTNFEAFSPNASFAKMSIKKLMVGLRFNMREFEIDPIVTIEEPEVHLSKPSGEGGVGQFPMGAVKAITRHIQLNVEGGKLILVGADDEIAPFYFSYKSHLENDSFGVLALSKSMMGLNSPMMEMSLSSMSGEMLTYFDFNQVDLDLFGKINQIFSLTKGNQWRVNSGFVSGNALMHYNARGTLKRGDVQVELENVHVTSANSSAEFALKSGTWRSSFPLARNKARAIHRSWVDFALKSHVTDLKVRMDDHTNFTLNGKFNMNMPKSEGIDLRGSLTIDEQTSAIVIQGDPYYGEVAHPEFGIRLSFKNETDGLSSIDFNIQHILENQFACKATCNRVDVEHLSLIQQILAPHIPDVARLDLKEGKFECELAASILDHKIKTLHLKKIIANNLHAQFDQDRLIAFCAKLEGALDVDLEKKQIDNWRIEVEAGDFVVKDATSVYDLSMSVASSRDIFAPSVVKGRIFDHNFDIAFSGERLHPEIEAIVKTNSNALLQHAPQAKVAKAPDSCDYTLRAKVTRGDDHWRIKGDIGDEHLLAFGFNILDFEAMSEIKEKVYAGWFKGNRISEGVHQWVAYLLDAGWQLKGDIDLIGRFDSNEFKCDVMSEKLAFLSESLDVSIDNEKRMMATVEYDIIDDKLDLVFPFEGACCAMKDFGLPIENMNGDLYIRDGNLFIHNMSGISCGLKMAGQLNLSLINAKPGHLDVRLPQVEGEMSGLKEIASHFPDFESISTQIEGNIVSRNEGFVFTTEFNPEDKPIEWSLAFRILDGDVTMSEKIHLANFCGNIDVNSNKDGYDVTHFNSKIVQEGAFKPYFVSGKKFNIDDDFIDFDLQLENETFSLARFVGSCREEEDVKRFTFDSKLSHLLGSTMEFKEVVVGDEPLPIEGDVQFDLDGKDLAIVRQFSADLGLLGPSVATLLKNVQCHDFIQVDFQFGKSLDIQCREMSCGSILSRPFHLTAHPRGSMLEVSNGAFGGMEFSCIADLSEVTLEKAEFRYRDSLLKLSNGRCEADRFVGVIEPSCLESALLKPYLGVQDELMGIIDLQGSFDLGSEKFTSTLSLASESLNGFSLMTKERCTLTYESDQDLHIDGLNLEIAHPGFDGEAFAIKADVIEFSDNETRFKDGEVAINSQMIDVMIEQNALAPLSEYFVMLKEQAPSLEWKHMMQFKADGLISARHYALNGVLKEGKYSLKGTTVDLRKPRFSFESGRLMLAFETTMQGVDVEIETLLSLGATRKVNVDIKRLGSGDAVHLVGALSDENELQCESITGKLYGAKLDFASRYAHDGEAETVLSGQIEFDPNAIDQLKTLGLTTPLFAHGEVMLNRKKLKNTYFKGYLKGRDLECKGYQLRNLLSNLYIDQNGLELKDFRLSDQAGLFVVQSAVVRPVDQHIAFDLRGIEVSEFRPSMLRDSFDEQVKMKPFVMRKLTIDQLSGESNDLNSIEGRGHLRFVNTFKSDHQQRLIPLELITRLGLDLGLLVPVKGEIDFIIAEQKMNLISLKNSFSEGKRSHFFFPSINHCYIGFDGDIHIDVKMKQYVLFKLTQPFTISLRGSVSKPKYSLKS